MTHRVRLLLAAVPLLVGSLALGTCTMPVVEAPASHRVDVVSVDLDPDTGSPVLLLRERGGELRELPIWIGQFEALSIALATEKIAVPRPNSHDLIKSLLDQLEGRVSRVVISELRGTTYYAMIEFEVGGRAVEIDSRPSDAVAVAIRTGTPIFATDDVLRQVDLVPAGRDAVEIDWLPRRPAIDPPSTRQQESTLLPNA